MRAFLLLIAVSLTSLVHADERSYVMLPYSLMADSVDSTLSKKEAVYMFDLSDLSPSIRAEKLIYSIE